MKTSFYHIILIIAALALFNSCREDEVIYIKDVVPVTQPEYTSVEGFYLLNEGVMQHDLASLDYYNYATGEYMRDVYTDANPTVVMELGDVGNDIGIYGSKMYMVINCSNKVEVVDKRSVKRIGQIDIPNCRYIKFHQGYAYVTSYVGPVVLEGEGSDDDVYQLGAVFKVDTTTLQVVDKCIVGRQPDELDIVDGKIYVANSGGYSQGAKIGYENTVSVIDIETFKEEERIPIAINLLGCKCDRRGILWVSSRGDYHGTPSMLYAYDTQKRRLVKSFDVRVGNMCLEGDSLYVISKEWSSVSQGYANGTYAIINTQTLEVVNENFITDGTNARIVQPYGIAVNPITKDIYVTDGLNFVQFGFLYCFGQDGAMKWRIRAGNIPAHFVFLGENINEQ
ncbi:MAG: YncE family protein [Muribaculaceae bacterium]|nr:YncE family protein [Muribaculaceae bacterium]